MPTLSQSSINTMSWIKLLLISAIVLSAAILMMFSVPAITDFAVYEVPSIYNGVVSWLRPPYLYLVINCIIITIVASSKLQSRKDDDYLSLSPAPLKPLEPMVIQNPQHVATIRNVESINQTDEYNYTGVLLNSTNGYDAKVEKGLGIDAYEHVDAIARQQKEVAPFAIDVAAGSGTLVFEDDAMSNKENEFVAAKSSWNAPDSKDLTEYSLANVRPPVSARFGHRKILKAASPEGGKSVLGVSKPKRQDTLESTWKTITEGRAIPLTRHLKKSDTWERDTHAHQQEKTPPKIMNKAETFNDRTNTRSPLMSPGSGGGGSTSGKLRREPSLTQDELNRRVEAFIKKFNEEMRLQRQESLNQYVQMINRGSR